MAAYLSLLISLPLFHLVEVITMGRSRRTGLCPRLIYCYEALDPLFTRLLVKSRSGLPKACDKSAASPGDDRPLGPHQWVRRSAQSAWCLGILGTNGLWFPTNSVPKFCTPNSPHCTPLAHLGTTGPCELNSGGPETLEGLLEAVTFAGRSVPSYFQSTKEPKSLPFSGAPASVPYVP